MNNVQTASLTKALSWQSFAIAAIVLPFAIFGGSAQFGQLFDLPVRLVAVLILVIIALRSDDFFAISSQRSLITISGVSTLLVALQLLPLPPYLWTHLPGRAPYAEIYDAIGVAPPWLSLSLAPERTLDALLFLLVPIAALCAGLTLNAAYRPAVIAGIIVAAVAGIGLSGFQMAQGPGGPAYLYATTSDGQTVGLFANRNHHGIFLACCVPLIWAMMMNGSAAGFKRAAFAIGFPLIVTFTLAMVATQSRAAMLIGLFGLFASALFIRDSDNIRDRRTYLLIIFAIAAAAFAYFSDQVAARFGLLADKFNRADAYTILAGIVRENLTFGTGVGTFELAAPRHEPLSILSGQYWNHAHNDACQIIAEAGVSGAALLAAFLTWFAQRMTSAIDGNASGRNLQLAAGFIILMLLAHSLVDYPLRTASLAALFGLCCAWLVPPPPPIAFRRPRP